MNLLCIGISHHTAPIEIREKLWFSDDEISSSLPLLAGDAFTEAVLFSTCNRTELYIIGEQARADALKTTLIERKRATGAVTPEHLFVLSGNSAVEHLFRVAAGVDSMILGDVQILSQIKHGYRLAQKRGTVGVLMNKLFQSAFHAGKRSRTETAIGEGAVSVSYAATELAGRIFDNMSEKTALVIGAGEMAELTAKHLHGKNIGRLWITNRTKERAESLSLRVGGSVIPFETFHHHLHEVDILISSIDVDRFVLGADEVRQIARQRKAPLFLIDIGVPRNLDPASKDLENVFLYDIDSLQLIVDENMHRRSGALPAVNKIIGEELTDFDRWQSSLAANPTISELLERAELIRKEEIEKNVNRFEGRERELLDLVTKRIVKKILHAPIVNMKNGRGASPQSILQRVALARSLFGLDGQNNTDDTREESRSENDSANDG